MRFADYFKEAIAYGESLGLRNESKERYADFAVELDEPKPVKLKNKDPFYPIFITVHDNSGLSISDLIVGADITVEQQVTLIKMFVSEYEQYLVDKKEPTAE